jgi:hypothetical protein
MVVKRNNRFIKVFTAVTFLLMVTVNALANRLPINGENTGQISNYYPNLFAPAGFTFAIPEVVWTVIMIAVGLGIGGATIFKNKDTAYGLVIIWAYTGILVKHTSASGFAGQYPSVITTVIICMVLLVIIEAYIISNGIKRGNR